MTLLLHSLVLGYGLAALGAFGLSDAGLPLWATVLVAWAGGNVLGLGFAVVGSFIWPDKPARRSSFTATADEIRLWDDDLTRELIHAEVRRDEAPATAPGTSAQPLRAAG